MVDLASSASDDEILGVVRRWCALLARGAYHEAFAMTAHDPYYGWTPGLMRDVIAGYGLPDAAGTCRVTAIDAATGDKPRHELSRWDVAAPRDDEYGPSVGEVWFDLPLDATWSDLTATFDLRLLGDRLVLVLNDIHVF